MFRSLLQPIWDLTHTYMERRYLRVIGYSWALWVRNFEEVKFDSGFAITLISGRLQELGCLVHSNGRTSLEALGIVCFILTSELFFLSLFILLFQPLVVVRWSVSLPCLALHFTLSNNGWLLLVGLGGHLNMLVSLKQVLNYSMNLDRCRTCPPDRGPLQPPI